MGGLGGRANDGGDDRRNMGQRGRCDVGWERGGRICASGLRRGRGGAGGERPRGEGDGGRRMGGRSLAVCEEGSDGRGRGVRKGGVDGDGEEGAEGDAEKTCLARAKGGKGERLAGQTRSREPARWEDGP